MTEDRPPRCRPLPAYVVEAVAEAEPGLSHPELLDRLDLALAALPPAERAAVVAAHGYADQSHLDREFRDHLGTSPTGWLAEEHRNIQAGGHRNGEA